MTTVGPVTRTEFVKQFKVIQEEGASFIIVIEDCEKSRIIATGTLVVEQKFIHRCGCVRQIIYELCISIIFLIFLSIRLVILKILL